MVDEAKRLARPGDRRGRRPRRSARRRTATHVIARDQRADGRRSRGPARARRRVASPTSRSSPASASRRSRSSCSTRAAAAPSSRSATATASTSSSACRSARSGSRSGSGSTGGLGGGPSTQARAAIAADLTRIDGRPSPSALVGMGGAITNITAVKHGLATYDPDVVQGTVLDRAEVDRQIELYRSRDADGRRDDRRPAAEARGGHPCRCLRRPDRHGHARQGQPDRERSRPPSRVARRTVWTPWRPSR